MSGSAGSHWAVAVVFEVVEGGSAEEAETRGVVVAAVNTARPNNAVTGLKEDGSQALDESLPYLDLRVVPGKVTRLPNLLHLPTRDTRMSRPQNFVYLLGFLDVE